MSRFLSSAGQALSPYTPGEQPQGRTFIKLNTNENPYPPSRAVTQAILAGAVSTEAVPELDALRLYSDPEEKKLVEAIASFYGVKPDQVMVGNGSDEVLAFSFRAFCDAETPLLSSDLTYGFYPCLCALLGVPFKTAALREDFTVDLPAFEHCGCTAVLANPNAPTGIALPLSAIRRILETNPDHAVIVDEAYVDFGGESAISLLPDYENLLVVQTFSKSRGLAGGRIGFAVGNPDLIRDLNRIRYSFNPYNVNRLSILAGAASIADRAYMEECTGRIQATRDRTAEELRKMGFYVTDSKANFLFAKSSVLGGKEYFDGLRENGILVRRWDTERIREFVRISIGTEEEMETFLQVTRRLLEQKKEEKA